MRISWVAGLLVLTGVATDACAQGGMEATAVSLSRAYLQAWSSDADPALRVTEHYAQHVRFYGRLLSRAELAGREPVASTKRRALMASGALQPRASISAWEQP